MELTGAKRQIDYVTDSGNKDWSTSSRSQVGMGSESDCLLGNYRDFRFSDKPNLTWLALHNSSQQACVTASNHNDICGRFRSNAWCLTDFCEKFMDFNAQVQQMWKITANYGKRQDSRFKIAVCNIVYVDFSKAFDVVSHRKLFMMLHCYGIRRTLLRWLIFFLVAYIALTLKIFCRTSLS